MVIADVFEIKARVFNYSVSDANQLSTRSMLCLLEGISIQALVACGRWATSTRVTLICFPQASSMTSCQLSLPPHDIAGGSSGLLRSQIRHILIAATSFSFFPMACPTISLMPISTAVTRKKVSWLDSSKCLFPFMAGIDPHSLSAALLLSLQNGLAALCGQLITADSVKEYPWRKEAF